jgi:hypothetical protein
VYGPREHAALGAPAQSQLPGVPPANPAAAAGTWQTVEMPRAEGLPADIKGES